MKNEEGTLLLYVKYDWSWSFNRHCADIQNVYDLNFNPIPISAHLYNNILELLDTTMSNPLNKTYNDEDYNLVLGEVIKAPEFILKDKSELDIKIMEDNSGL